MSALSNAEPLSICGVITVGALSNFHRLAQHSLLRRCIRGFYGYVLGYCISSQKFFRLMHTHYNWQSILFDSAALHDLDAQMLQPLYSFASFLHTWISIQWYVLIRYGYIREVYQYTVVTEFAYHLWCSAYSLYASAYRSISRWLIVLFWLYYSKVPCAFVRSPFNGYLYSS
jgi:hypothetical protein